MWSLYWTWNWPDLLQHRLLHLSEIYGEDKVREVFPTCLRGTAAFCHTTELTALERQLFATAPLQVIIPEVINRFKEQATVALKAAQMTSVYNQLLSLWNGLNMNIKMHIPMPEENTTMAAFLQQLDAKVPFLDELASRNASSRMTGPAQQSPRSLLCEGY
ncbi:hypothetical protein F5884DRAFT_751328 [Xylogone sp. PMI_703]|nr:hypothetical protein F5884DRAFT_751328 [Xylogone sp. PMI_703]